MQTNRFETFMDAVLAIIITVLVLKLAQPEAATWNGILNQSMGYMTYFACFLIIFNTWYNDHTLFQVVENIDNKIVSVYGIMIFILSLVPFFATWVVLNPFSVPAQTMFGSLFLLTNILYTLSTYLIIKSNPYNEKLTAINLKDYRKYIPLIMLLVGFVITYTVYVPAIFIACMFSAVYWFVLAIKLNLEIKDIERFEAFVDAIIAIILTVIVLEITMASNGSWQALFDLKLEFISYIISFVVCFNYWNYNNNLFQIIKNVDVKVVWLFGLALFVLSFIPYLSTFVSENFNSFIAQACYGIDFIVVALLSIATSNALKKTNKENDTLLMVLRDHYSFYSTLIIVGIGIIIGYFFYPPAIIISCLVSIIAAWVMQYIRM